MEVDGGGDQKNLCFTGGRIIDQNRYLNPNHDVSEP